MAIFGRFGGQCKIIRLATLEDVKTLEGREPDHQDCQAVEGSRYMIVEFDDSPGKYQVYHPAYLRATNGFSEIAEAVEAVKDQ